MATLSQRSLPSDVILFTTHLHSSVYRPGLAGGGLSVVSRPLLRPYFFKIVAKSRILSILYFPNKLRYNVIEAHSGLAEIPQGIIVTLRSTLFSTLVFRAV